MENLQWYVLQCKPRKEAQVHNQLRSKDINSYYPTLNIKPVNPRASKIRPYFPGYVFVQADLDVVGVGNLNWLPGVLHPVQFGDHFATVAEDFIHALKQKVDEINAFGCLKNFQKGDRVRITEGPLAGYDAIFDMYLSEADRVVIFLDMLGRMSKTKISLNAIQKNAKGN